jgi:hypothetical protein
MAVLNIGMRKVFPNFFSGKSWTIGKELFWILVNIMFIGIANTIYSSYLNFFPLNILTFLRFIFYVLVIGLFPVTIFTFIRQSVLQKKFIKESNVINVIINIPLHVPQQYEASIISIPSQNVNEHFSVTVSEILFIRSADNYVEIFYMEKDKVNRKLIRNLMKQVESNLRAYPQFFRCHKSFLINLEKVSHVSGNAQGLKLTLKGIEELIPVSRNLTKIVRKKIAAYH